MIVGLTRGRLPVVAVGGIFDTDDARRALDAGAALVQVYTGLVYRGPVLVRTILKGLSG
jgi:dihydroorotate dehydrogenase